jgi:hypothetical protein
MTAVASNLAQNKIRTFNTGECFAASSVDTQEFQDGILAYHDCYIVPKAGNLHAPFITSQVTELCIPNLIITIQCALQICKQSMAVQNLSGIIPQR